VSTRPPAIVLGGDSNALSIARSLGRLGVEVFGIGVAPFVGRSRHLKLIEVADSRDPEADWAACLLGRATDHLQGAVVLAGSDVGLVVLARHRQELAERFALDISDVDSQLTMLDKLRTYEVARDAGVPTPMFWRIDTPSDLERHRTALVYPLIVKPLLSHHFQSAFPGLSKFRVVSGEDELLEAYGELTAAGLAVMLVEKIQMPDDHLCSYYTYLDESYTALFDFTKRVIRRNPPGMGVGTYHITDWNPEVRDAAMRLFKAVGLQGLANAEFIRDDRDGRLKLIECNARFTAANPLVTAAGLDLAKFVYLRIIGSPVELPRQYTVGLRLLYPSDDVRAFLALRTRGKLGPVGWLRSLAHRQTFAYARWDDPGPAVSRALLRSSRGLRKAIGTVRARTRTEAGSN